MRIKLSKFGVVKEVEATLHNMTEDESVEEVLWTERPEDMYALLSPQLSNKRVAIVTRRSWLDGTLIEVL